MATLEETRKSLDEKTEKKSLSESLNLSDYSPGTSNFDSGILEWHDTELIIWARDRSQVMISIWVFQTRALKNDIL